MDAHPRPSPPQPQDLPLAERFLSRARDSASLVALGSAKRKEEIWRRQRDSAGKDGKDSSMYRLEQAWNWLLGTVTSLSEQQWCELRKIATPYHPGVHSWSFDLGRLHSLGLEPLTQAT